MSGLFLFLSIDSIRDYFIKSLRRSTKLLLRYFSRTILFSANSSGVPWNKIFLSFKQQISTIGNAQRLLHIVVSNQNADIPIFQLPHNLLNILHCNRVYTGKRLVQHNKFGVNGQTTGNFCTAPLAT